ncbi:MAG: hypothetical protein ACIAQU_01405 [Phycisphaerales bacterium JB064]
MTDGRGTRREPLNAAAFATTGDTVLVPPPVEASEIEAAGPEIVPAPSSRAQSVLFDVKVGEVNNKPIFAAEFLRPLEQRLRTEAYVDVTMPGGGTVAQLKPRAQWQREAAQIINEQLVTFINNELVIAEGLASFTPAQRASLRNFLGLVQENLARRSGGSITRAVRELGTGQTLSEYLQDVRNQELISKFAEELQRSVVVTRSDVERAYLQKYGDNRKPSSATFRRIRVWNDDPEGVARVGDRLGRGEPFAEVATDEANSSRRSEAGLWPSLNFEGEYEEAAFFPNDPEIQQEVVELTPGEWAGPITDERYTHWVYLETIEIGFKTWAEAQSELRRELLDRRLDEAYQRAMQRLYEQAGMTDLNVMSNELLAVATEWFYPDE